MMGYDCTAQVFSGILAIPTPKACSRSLARSPRRPSPRGACSAAQVQQHHIASYRIHPRHRHPSFAAPPRKPWPYVVQVDVPYRRAMGLHALIRGQNLASHTSCSPQSRLAASPALCKAPAKRAEQGFSALTAQRGSGCRGYGRVISLYFACLSQRPASRHSKRGASVNPRRRFAAVREAWPPSQRRQSGRAL